MKHYRLALGALGVTACALTFAAGYSVHSTTHTETLADRASVSLQASYNAQQMAKMVPLRIVGAPVCKETRNISPTAGSMSCTATLVGTRAVGGCIQVIGIYYDKLASFAESLSSVVPCEGE